MPPAVSKVMATVNAPYSAPVTPAQLAAKITDLKSASTCDVAVFAFLSEVSLKLQYEFINEMDLNVAEVAQVASEFSSKAGYKLALAA